MLTLAGASMAWEAEHRIFHAWYTAGARPDAHHADEMQRWMDALAGPHAPFDLIVDLRHADKVAIRWRFRWLSWFYRHRARMRTAIYHADAIGSTVVNAFALSTRTTIRAFPGEDEARAWLMEAPRLAGAHESI